MSAPKRARVETVDGCSQSSLETVTTKSLHLDLSVDFSQKTLSGFVQLHLALCGPAVTEVALDTRNLTVKKCEQQAPDGTWQETTFRSEPAHEALGTKLVVALGRNSSDGNSAKIRCHYATDPENMAIQWLEAEQTADRTHPYLFTQCQAIHARCLFPCQDSPSVKATYTARILVPAGLTALMSANKLATESQPDGRTAQNFSQDLPIPSYLVALAVGRVESRTLSPRVHVWAEPSVVDAAAHEFADTERFLAIAEEITGVPYLWGNYDLLVLPPSFPYGGMENPCLTFITPTLLAGDRSLASVVAHEIAHSWTGNLITNATWEHFWLNESFTVFLERKIMAQFTQSESMRHLLADLGWDELREAVSNYGETHDYTCLVPYLNGVDPDDAFSSVPYEKGFFLLWAVESIVGRGEMEAFLRSYIATFKTKSITTAQFKAHLVAHFAEVKQVQEIDFDHWFYAPGMPLAKPAFDLTLLHSAQLLATRWQAVPHASSADAVAAHFAASDLEWTCNQTLVFLKEILAHWSVDDAAKFSALTRVYRLAETKNCEIRFLWIRLGLKCGDDSVLPHFEDMVTSQGRMKYTRPLYRDVYALGGAKRDLAVALFKKLASRYHAICRKMVAKDLQLA